MLVRPAAATSPIFFPDREALAEALLDNFNEEAIEGVLVPVLELVEELLQALNVTSVRTIDKKPEINVINPPLTGG